MRIVLLRLTVFAILTRFMFLMVWLGGIGLFCSDGEFEPSTWKEKDDEKGMQRC
jgi:hypothetical protein